MSSAKKEAKKAAKAAAKQEKAAAKAAKRAADPEGYASLRNTIIKSVTAFVCVIALCISSVVAINNYSDAIVKAAEVAPAPSSSAAAPADDSSAVADDSSAVADDSSAAADDSAAAADDSSAAAADDSSAAAADNSSAAAASSSSSSSASSSSAAPASSSKDPTSFNKAQAVEYYNNSIKNAAKAPKLKAVKKENTAIRIDSMKPNLTDLGNKIVGKYAVPKTSTATFANGKPTSGTEKTASDFLIKTRLEPAGAKSATVTKSGSNYLVTIHIVPEKSTLNTKPKYNEQCVYPLDLNSVDLFGLKVTEANFTYPGTTLTALVNPQGLAIKTTADQPLSGTGGGKFIAVSVEATVSGKWTQQIDYSY